MNEKKQNPNASARTRLAEQLFVNMVAHGRGLQVNLGQVVTEARLAAEAFYPDEETPAPSTPINKAT